MEESSELKLKRLSFSTQHPLPSYRNGRLEKIGITKALKHLKEEKASSSCYNPLDIPKGTHQAMEFLSRSWSPSSSNFFQILSSNSLLLPLDGNGRIDEHDDERLEKEETKRNMASRNKGNVETMDSIWALPATRRSVSWVLQGHRLLDNSWGWLRGQSMVRFSKGCREKKKEEIRLKMAQVHAALSVAQLAAAVAGFVAEGESNPRDLKNKNMGIVVASAAALVATVCAEAAESVGAHRTHVASIVNSGLATRTAADMIELTATAATCLRGAATLKSITSTANTCFSKNQEMLARGLQLPIRSPSGKSPPRMVWIYLKHNELILRLGKKYFGGVLTTSKDYKITDVTEETKEAQGFYLLSLSTNGGTIELLFEDEKKSNVWRSTVSQLLVNLNPHLITNPTKHL